MARPAKLEVTDDVLRQIEEMAGLGLNQEQLAGILGIAARTFRELMERDERVSAAWKKGKSEGTHEYARNLLSQSRAGNVAATIFYLKTKAGWTEPATRIEHSGPNAGPIVTRNVSDLSDAELDELIHNAKSQLDAIDELEAESPGNDPAAPTGASEGA